VAVLVTGLYLGHRLPTLMSAGSRLQMNAFWQMVKFLLEGLVSSLSGCSCATSSPTSILAGS
jgi:CPA1 family monovalent cation:H+ antiporter